MADTTITLTALVAVAAPLLGAAGTAFAKLWIAYQQVQKDCTAERLAAETRHDAEVAALRAELASARAELSEEIRQHNKTAAIALKLHERQSSGNSRPPIS